MTAIPLNAMASTMNAMAMMTTWRGCVGYVVADLSGAGPEEGRDPRDRKGPGKGRLRGTRSPPPPPRDDDRGGSEVGHGTRWRVVPARRIDLHPAGHQVEEGGLNILR